MMRERIILTGASGTLGYSLATQLATSPKTTVLCLQRESSQHRGFSAGAAAAEFGVPLTVVRPFSFTGPADNGSRLFPSLLRAAVERRPFDMSSGDQVRDHCAVQDIAAGVLAAAWSGGRSPQPLSVYNLGSGSTIPLKPLIEQVVLELDLDVKLNFGARDYARFEPRFMVADASLALTTLGWRPQVNLAYAVWQLAQESFPTLRLRKPQERSCS